MIVYADILFEHRLLESIQLIYHFLSGTIFLELSSKKKPWIYSVDIDGRGTYAS